MNGFPKCLALLALAFALPAAQADTAPVEVKVTFSDLNVATPAGARALYQRMRRGAEAVCAPHDGKDAEHHGRFRSCVGQALARAVTTVDRPVLTAVAQGRDPMKTEAATVANR